MLKVIISYIPTGIFDIPAKLNDMCPNYELWNSWFGEHQKYDPSSIVQSEFVGDGEGVGDNNAAAEDDDAEGEELINSQEGNSAFCNVSADGEGGFDAGLDAVREDAAAATRDAIVSPKQGGSVPPSPMGVSPRAGSKRAKTGAAVGSSVALLQAATAKQQLQNIITSPPIVSSPSQSSSGSGKQTFDAVYAKAAESKVICLKDIAKTQAANAIEIQKGEHHFQSQKLILEMKLANEERKSRQKIEFEKNIASLFVADSSGKLAQDFMTVLRDEQQRQASLQGAGDEALVAFANSLSR